MENKQLHIVFLDNPYPADYGGAIDMYYKAQAIKNLGYSLTLHVFEYGRARNEALNVLGKVHYYPRKKNVFSLFSFLPFIVKTRASKLLFTRLSEDNHPVLFEGLHCCAFLKKLKHKETIVRTHNIEHHYYNKLSKNASLIKKYYYLFEARKLKFFEKKLIYANHLWCISEKDRVHFNSFHPSCFTLLPCFNIEQQIEECETKPYVLFHGNLSVEENEAAIDKILDCCFDLDYTFIVAGKNPSEKIINEIERAPNFTLIENPNHQELKVLINEAHIQLLITGQATGAKLKLIIGLCGNGHVIANDKILEGTNLAPYCISINEQSDINECILNAFRNDLKKEEHEKRIAFIKSHYDLKKNLRALLNLLNK